ncbi:putative ubiquitin regulatory protein (ISS) [Trypanosoma grayi]|uniref:putative ubiquitin regulatory protein (ISS) n=1 Tax=Trypanosoma grayi TaxID=71804 RepID=UPI0004F48BED|nr:putative ubiquitin regulatory protein (ISS) [Trypanosoma grayi]KEG13444.1 putative ubiquitin regulatory protein (ISS) [Trypanosoma grayi]
MSGREGQTESDAKGVRENSPHPSSCTSSCDDDQKTYFISQSLFESLQNKGFSDNAIKKSIVAGCVDEGTCTQWITMHEGHPDLDTPLENGVEVTVRVKRVLTEVEREAKVRELREKAKAKVEEEKHLAAEEERKRIEMGRKALETKEMLDKLRMESELAEVRRQKEADALARRRVKVQILADKYVRQGMSSEEALRFAESEFEEAARKKREEATALMSKMTEENVTGTTASTGAWDLHGIAARAVPLSDLFDKPAEPPSSLPSLVDAILQHEDTEAARQCFTVLRTVLTNILNNPFDTTKRSLKTSSSAFCMKVAPVLPALHLLHTCGFQLATDANGNESLTATTVVIRVLARALALLPKEA